MCCLRRCARTVRYSVRTLALLTVFMLVRSRPGFAPFPSFRDAFEHYMPSGDCRQIGSELRYQIVQIWYTGYDRSGHTIGYTGYKDTAH
jgi:hypothetical protein